MSLCLVLGRPDIGCRVLDPGHSRSHGLRCVVVQVSHDVGEYRVVVEPVGGVPGVRIVHVWAVRSMNLADSSKMRGASLSMVATVSYTHLRAHETDSYL